MIEYIEGDIFDSPAQVIVNTVNTVGVMGKGLALAFKQRYPKMFERYRAVCEKKMFSVGQLMLFNEPDHWVLLFPTKENWRNPSKLEYIEKGLKKFVETYAEKNITSIAFPRLGCGNGELQWNDVRILMERYLRPLPIDVYIYLGVNPDAEPEHKEKKKTAEWLKNNAKDLSFNGVIDEIRTSTEIIPHTFKAFGDSYNASYDNGLNIIRDGAEEALIITEDDFYDIWDDMRRKCVFSTPEIPNAVSLVHSLLYSLGYTTKIRIYDTLSQQMKDGYQINEGSGRVYSLKGN